MLVVCCCLRGILRSCCTSPTGRVRSDIHLRCPLEYLHSITCGFSVENTPCSRAIRTVLCFFGRRPAASAFPVPIPTLLPLFGLIRASGCCWDQEAHILFLCARHVLSAPLPQFRCPVRFSKHACILSLSLHPLSSSSSRISKLRLQ